MRIHCFQHVSFENLGNISGWVNEKNHTLSYTHFFEKEPVFPELDTIDALIILGGYMNVDEEDKYPWLRSEKEYVRKAIEAKKKVLGICLGSQLIASVLGSKVYANTQKEIGFYPIEIEPQNALFSHFQRPSVVFHWHGDTFDLPQNTKPIASSKACQNQAYMLENHVLGLQFHLEMNQTIIEQMLMHDGVELQEKGDFIQTKETIRNQYGCLEQNQKDMFTLLDKFFEL